MGMTLDQCVICHEDIKAMAFRGTGVCGENHFKERAARQEKGEILIDGVLHRGARLEWTVQPEDLSKDTVAILYGGTVATGGQGAAQLAQGSVERAPRPPAMRTRWLRFLRGS